MVLMLGVEELVGVKAQVVGPDLTELCLLKKTVGLDPRKKPIPSREGEASSYTHPALHLPVCGSLGRMACGGSTPSPRAETRHRHRSIMFDLPCRPFSCGVRTPTNPDTHGPGPREPRQSGPAPYSSGGWHGRSDGSWPAPDEARPASSGLHGRCQGDGRREWGGSIGPVEDWRVGGMRGMGGLEFALQVGRSVKLAQSISTELRAVPLPFFPW